MGKFKMFYESQKSLIEETVNRINRYSTMFAKYPSALNEVRSIVDFLKRDDRIIYMLRILKYEYEPSTKFAYVENFFENNHSIPEATVELEHFLSLGIPSIDNFTFDRQEYDDIIAFFKEAEDDYRSSNTNQLIDMSVDNQATVIIRMNEYTWFNLNRSSCPVEGDAMGHCGNTATDEGTVLSLRKKMKNEYKPVATFILDDDGFIGEAKGRANEKPAKRYHPYIVQLLLHKENGDWFVRGLKGGGYLPESNFNVADLSKDLQDVLFNERPELKPTWLKLANSPLPEFENIIESQKEQLISTSFLCGGTALDFVEVVSNGVVYATKNKKRFYNTIHEDLFKRATDSTYLLKQKHPSYDYNDRTEYKPFRNVLSSIEYVWNNLTDVSKNKLKEYVGYEGDDFITYINEQPNEGRVRKTVRILFDAVEELITSNAIKEFNKFCKEHITASFSTRYNKDGLLNYKNDVLKDSDLKASLYSVDGKTKFLLDRYTVVNLQRQKDEGNIRTVAFDVDFPYIDEEDLPAFKNISLDNEWVMKGINKSIRYID